MSVTCTCFVQAISTEPVKEFQPNLYKQSLPAINKLITVISRLIAAAIISKHGWNV